MLAPRLCKGLESAQFFLEQCEVWDLDLHKVLI